MEFEIYDCTDSKGEKLKRVNIGDESYALTMPDNGVRKNHQGNVGCSLDSDAIRCGDEVLGAWLKAAKIEGVPLRFSWKGILNSAGHYAKVMPPWKPREKNYGRG